MELLRPLPLVKPLSINPLRPSGPIRRTCGVIKLPVTCVAPRTDEDSKNNVVPLTTTTPSSNTEQVNNNAQNPTSTSVSTASIVVPQYWESRLCGVKAYNHETGSEISIELKQPQNGLSVSSSTLTTGVNLSTSSLQSLIQSTQQTVQSSLSVSSGAHTLIQALSSGTNGSNTSFTSPSQQHKSVISPKTVVSPVPSLLKHSVNMVSVSPSGRENGQGQNSTGANSGIVGRQQTHLPATGKEFRQSSVSLTQSTNVTSAVPGFRVSPIVVNGPSKTTTTSVNAEGVTTHYVSDNELLMQEEKVRLLRQKLMAAAQNSS